MSRSARAALGLAATASCVGAPTTAWFDPAGDDFYALPFPNDLRRDDDGTIGLAALPTNSAIVDAYRAAADSLDGFALNAPIYARFDADLDPGSLPDPAGSLAPGAAVYLVDVDPASPTRGARTPIIARYRAAPTRTLGAHHLVARPVPGFGLREATTYALVITRRVRGDNGEAVEPAAGLAAVLASAPEYAPLRDWLDEPGGDARADVVSAAVFTTQVATQIAPALRRAIYARPAPVARDVGFVPPAEPAPGDPSGPPAPPRAFVVITGNYLAASFQRGPVPYANAPDGAIEVGADGVAIVQRDEVMRFALAVPPGPTPPAGWPLAIYQHGTGGDWLTFVDDGTAAALVAEGIATISTDQVLHGPRNPGGDPELAFFNIANPYAMRDNPLQGAADAWSLLRLAHGLSVRDRGRTIRVDPRAVFFFGHSQGGATGPGFVAFEPSVRGAVLSGTAGLLTLSLLYKTAPLDIPMLLATFLRDDPLDEDNPSIAIAQTWFERTDGINYAPLMVREPPRGDDGVPLAPRNVLQTEGFVDTFTPNPALEAFATALGGDLVRTVDATDVAGLALRGRDVLAPPFSGNVEVAGTRVTAALAQYAQVADSDGHFVVFDVPAARQQAAAFLGTLARTGVATVVAAP